jgi:hypothetical protein
VAGHASLTCRVPETLRPPQLHFTALQEATASSQTLIIHTAPPPTPHCTRRFADVKGVDEAKAELEEIVEYLKDPHKFTALGGKLPKVCLEAGRQMGAPRRLARCHSLPSILSDTTQRNPTHTHRHLPHPTGRPAGGPTRHWEDDAGARDCWRGRGSLFLHKRLRV